MDTELENPVITDESEAKFLEAAALADAGQDIPANLVPGAEAESPTAPEKKEDVPSEEQQPDNSVTDPEKKDDRPRDELGRFTKKLDGTDIPEAERQPAEQKPAAQPSEFEAKRQEKKKQEEERLEKTWENVNRRKDELAERERALQQQEQTLRQQMQQPRQVQEQQREFTSRDLFTAAQDFKARAKKALEEADYDAFNENTALAEAAEQHAQQFYQVEAREAQQTQLHQYGQVWNGHMQKAIESDPDLVKADTPLAKAMHSLLETHGQVFWMIPDGFAKAVEIAKLRLEAGSASELRAANQKLQAEVERLNGLTSIGGSGPTSQPAPKKFEDMSEEEQNAQLLRAAAAVDESRQY